MRTAAVRVADGHGGWTSIELDDHAVTIHGARVEQRGERHWVVANPDQPTLVNGEVVREQQLAHNDVIQIGDAYARYVEDSTEDLIVPGARSSFEPSQTDRSLMPISGLVGTVIVMPTGPDASPPSQPGSKPR